MKFGITYNVFDGVELLDESIDRIYDSVDYINICIQTISNYNQEISSLDYNEVLRLCDKYNIELIKYTPEKINPSINEAKKRDIGLQKCKTEGCDYCMLMDCDEYYIPSEFKNMLDYCIKNDPDAVFCSLYTYYKTKEYILDPPEDYKVGLMYKLYPESKIQFGKPFPKNLLCDPTRRVNTINQAHLLNRNIINMHHLSYIRSDIRRKFENSSARVNYNKHIDDAVDYYEKWNEGEDALMLGKSKNYIKVKKVNYLE